MIKSVEKIQILLENFIQGGSLTKIVLTFFGFIIAWYIINIASAKLKNFLNKKDYDKTIIPFTLSLFTWALRAGLFIFIASYLGFETTSFVALLGAFGFAFGMALQGALGNLAGGVLILANRPYKVGDLVEMQGHIGNVKEIQIFNTILTSPENKTVILPNGAVSNGNIVNYTIEGMIRVDLTIGISYNANIQKAKEVLIKVMKSDKNVLQEPEPFVGVLELADSSVYLAVRPYAKPEFYWDVYFAIYEKSKNALDSENIEIPFPQMDVHLEK